MKYKYNGSEDNIRYMGIGFGDCFDIDQSTILFFIKKRKCIFKECEDAHSQKKEGKRENLFFWLYMALSLIVFCIIFANLK